jgi:hypothetical protein
VIAAMQHTAGWFAMAALAVKLSTGMLWNLRLGPLPNLSFSDEAAPHDFKWPGRKSCLGIWVTGLNWTPSGVSRSARHWPELLVWEHAGLRYLNDDERMALALMTGVARLRETCVGGDKLSLIRRLDRSIDLI